jgi:hypothetical protein
MSNRMFKTSMSAIGAAVLFGVSASQATVIMKNGNITVASDTYDGDTAGSPVVADSGNWDSSNGNFIWYPRSLARATTAGSPGPYSGSGYAVMGDGGGGYPGNQGAEPPQSDHLTATMSLAAGNTLKFDSMVYIPASTAAVDFPFQFMVIGAPAIDGSTIAATNRLLDFYRNANGTWGATNVGGTFAGPTSFQADTWQHWVLDYTVGAASATLTIDGIGASIPASHTTLQGSSGVLSIISNYGSANPARPFYFDSVPEPSSLAAVGGVGLLALPRNRRVA